MEESTEAHMETDVSSTTEDVPEAQEVTGSNGNVEMVVIVEKVTEEESCSNEAADNQLSAGETEVATSSNTQSPAISPQKPTDDLKTMKSPSKITEVENSPAVEEHSYEKVSQEDKNAYLHSASQVEEAVDSSSVIEVTKSPQRTPQKRLSTPKLLSPVRGMEIQKSPKALSQSPKSLPPSPRPSVSPKPSSTSPKTPLVTPESPVVIPKSPSVIPKSPSVISNSPSVIPNSPSVIPNSPSVIPNSPSVIPNSPSVIPDSPSVIPKPPLAKEQSKELKMATPIKELTPEKPALNGNIENGVIEKEESSTKNDTVPLEIVQKEASDDSQLELNTDTSEKEHNKSISRELKSLIKSAKESKIISECTQLTTKTRKSRAPLDTSNSSLNVSVEAERIKDIRRNSDNSQKSNGSEKSEKAPAKRSMRSQNPEFVNKVKLFLNSVTSKVQKESDEGTDEETEATKKEEVKVNRDSFKDSSKKEYVPSLAKKKRAAECGQEENVKLNTDPYCWRCHWEVEQPTNEKTHSPMTCTVCPRAFHYKCLSTTERGKINTEKSWVCPECYGMLHADGSDTRSPAMKKISSGMLSDLLKHALERMMDLNGVEPFMQPVDRSMFPDYDKYVVYPMDLSQMKANIAQDHYGSTEAFLADAQWILHNSIIFNTFQSKLTAAARTLMRSCRAEMGEIEACPECYSAAHARKPTWFTDVCSTPHMLLWAKLKGFPYWPAKGMSVSNGCMVDVRFFGAHDRAWVPAKDCFLYSEKDPNNFRTKRQDLLDSMQEAEEHIRNISRKYGKFVYPPFKTQFDPSKLTEQLKMMIPSFEGELRAPAKEKSNNGPSVVKDKIRSSSKSSKSSLRDSNCDMSEGEEASSVKSRKMADGADILRLAEDEKDRMDVDESLHKEESNDKTEINSRKRRRSEMEEASIITIISSSSKKTKKENAKTTVEGLKNKTESQASVSKEDKPKEGEGKEKINTSTPKGKDNEPTSSTADKEKESTRHTPIRLVISTKSNKIVNKSIPKTNTITPKGRPLKIKQTSLDKSITITKISKDKDNKVGKLKVKRRSSKNNKSLNNSNAAANGVKTEKTTERKSVPNADSVANKDKRESTPTKSKEDLNKSSVKPNTPKVSTESPKPAKERIQFDEDDTSLAVIARGSKSTVANDDLTCLPTITSVRSLSNAPSNVLAKSKGRTIEVSIEPNPNSLLVTNANVQKDGAKAKETTSLVGKVGVRAFARMASPEKQTNKKVEVEIKAEPIDFEDQDRQLEKLDMMRAFKLRPVAQPQPQPQPQPATSLREVRINKVVMTPLNARKTATKPPEVRPRARKTFPQPRKSDEGRSELNSKNSMVYIPIQPPATPGPRPRAPLVLTSVNTGVPRLTGATLTTVSNSLVNTIMSPLVPSSLPQLSSPIASSSTAPNSPYQLVPTIGQVPTTVHTVPLITSVNGQWTFSLQPIMSVGGLDDAPSPPLLNGLSERNNGAASLLALPSSSNMPASVMAVPDSAPGTMTRTVMSSGGPSGISAGMPGPAGSTLSGPSGSTFSSAVVTSVTSSAPAIVPLSPAPVTPVRASEDSQSGSTPGELPRLQQRPVLMNPLDSLTPVGDLPPPSTVGPVTAKLNQNAVKLTDFFRTLLEDSLEKLEDPSCQLTSLRMQLEQAQWRHKVALSEMKHNHELVLAEMRASFEKEKTRFTSELRRVAQADLEAAVKMAKSKQWCANCSQEAQFYCCWNTSYCDYPCQRAHWTTHFAVCTQPRPQEANDSGNNGPESRLQPQPDKFSKTATAPITTPALTVGGKLAQRGDQQKQQSSIIMNVDGNQGIRCVGAYGAPPPAPAPAPPVIISKQIINNEDANKKVVTSGGYLIVGAAPPLAANASQVQSRRAHTIQYYT